MYGECSSDEDNAVDEAFLEALWIKVEVGGTKWCIVALWWEIVVDYANS